MMATYKNAFFLLSILLATKSFAIDIVSHSINGLVFEDASGPYPKLLTKLNDAIGTELSFKVIPVKRAVYHFENKHDDCLLSGNSLTIKNPEKYLVSNPLSEIKLHFFNLQHMPPITSFNDLNQNKLIGGILGIDALYKKVLPKEHKLTLVSSDEQSINMLVAKRVQAILGFIPDLNAHLDILHYDETFVLYHGSDNLICHDTQENRDYLKRINQALEDIKASPTYDEIMP